MFDWDEENTPEDIEAGAISFIREEEDDNEAVKKS